MYMYMYMYICICIYIYVYIYVHTYTFIFIDRITLVFMSHIWVVLFALNESVTHLNEWVPCHTYEWVSAFHVTQFMSHIWMSGCLSSCDVHECVSASLRCEWVLSHIRIRKHQRMCFRYVPATEWRSRDEMTAMRTCVDTQYVAVCYSVLQCVAVCCSVL